MLGKNCVFKKKKIMFKYVTMFSYELFFDISIEVIVLLITAKTCRLFLRDCIKVGEVFRSW